MGVRHPLLPILTVGKPADIFNYVSSPRQLFFQLRLQALTRLGYIPRHLVYQPRLSQALPRLRFLRPQPYTTYVTGGVPPSASNNPHVGLSCGHLVLLIITAPPCFYLRLPQALPRFRYNPGHLVLLPRLPQVIPLQMFQKPQP